MLQSLNPSHILVRAGAGTGKTTTITNGAAVMKGYQPNIRPTDEQQAIWDEMRKETMPGKVHLTSFSTAAAEQLLDKTKRLCSDKDITCSGTYGMGLRQSYAAGYAMETKGRIHWKKYENLIADALGKNKYQGGDYFRALQQMVDMARLETFTELTDREVEKLANWYGVDLTGGKLETTTEIINEVLALGRADRARYDYTDMVWLPLVDGLIRRTYDNLVVDEYQDMSAAEQEICMRISWRLLVIGDHHQAIYGFKGADANAYKRMDNWLKKTQRGLTTLPLTRTRRCCHAVVDLVNKRLPPEDWLRCMDEAPDGQVMETRTGALSYGDHDIWDPSFRQDGIRKTMVICPTNAPLVSLNYRLQKQGIKAYVMSKDMQNDLLALIPDTVQTTTGLICLMDDKIDRLDRKSGRAVQAKRDTFRTMQEIAKECTTLSAVKSTIKAMFPEKEPAGWLRESSVHQAKGLEAETVVFWEWDRCNSPYSKLDWQKQQDKNLMHVGDTRAMTRLVRARSEEAW